MQTINEYLKNVNSAQKAEYNRLRKIVKGIVPDAEETISYGIATFKHKGKYVLYFGAYKDHMSVHPILEGLQKKFGDKLKQFQSGKGTLRYTEKKLIPEEIVKTMVELRKADIDG